VSVIVPTHNHRELLASTIQSVRAQTFCEWELVIVDDTSTDDTVALLEESQAEEPRLRYYRRAVSFSNANVCRNQGLKAARGKYIVFLDSDDLLSPQCLHPRVSLMEANPILDFAIFPGYCFRREPGDHDGVIGSCSGAGELGRLLAMSWPFQTSGPIWRRSALEVVGRWDESLPSRQDVDLHFRALLKKLVYVRGATPDSYFRVSQDYDKTSTQQISEPGHFDSARKLFSGINAQLRDAGMLTHARAHLLDRSYFFVAECQIRSGWWLQASKTWNLARTEGLCGRRVIATGRLYLLLLKLGLGQFAPVRAWSSRWKRNWPLTRGGWNF
jgi:glycosyltransferase involved in cell wall biosynthesis